MRTLTAAVVGAALLAWTPQARSAAGFSVDCETRAVEKDHGGNTISTGEEKSFRIVASDSSMNVSGNGSQIDYKTFKMGSTVASYYLNSNVLKYKMRGPEGGLDISIDRTTGEIYEMIDTKGRFIIVRGACHSPDMGSRF